MLVDVFSKGLTGKVAEAALGQAGITVNKNAIPFDKNPPMVASGIRVGTPAVTTRGMREPEMDRIASLFARALAAPDDAAALAAVKADVETLCAEFPLYPTGLHLDDRAGPALTIAALMSLGARVDAIFSPDGPLAQTLAAFEPRDGQRRMAAAVADTLEDGGVLLVEAGTGTGKTLAYLVPAILSGQRVRRLDRHQEPAGADLHQGSAAARPGAAGVVHRHLHEGPRQLPLPAALRESSRSRRRCAPTSIACTSR